MDLYKREVHVEISGSKDPLSHFGIWAFAKYCKCKCKPEKDRHLRKHCSNRKRFPSLGVQGRPGQCCPQQAGHSVGTFHALGSSSHQPHSEGACSLLEDRTVCYRKWWCCYDCTIIRRFHNFLPICQFKPTSWLFPKDDSYQPGRVKTSMSQGKKECHPSHPEYIVNFGPCDSRPWIAVASSRFKRLTLGWTLFCCTKLELV